MGWRRGRPPEGRGKKHQGSVKDQAMENIPEWKEWAPEPWKGVNQVGGNSCMGISSKTAQIFTLLVTAVTSNNA